MARPGKGGLEERVTTIPRRKGIARRVVEYMIPFLDEPDYRGMAESLLNDPKVMKTGIHLNEALGYVQESYNSNKWLRRAGMLADTADRATSLVGMILESAGIAAGIAPGFGINAGEEAAEIVFKLPFLSYVMANKDHRQKAKGLLRKELITALVPAAGDVYDIAVNTYMGTAYDIIREDARQRVLLNFRH